MESRAGANHAGRSRKVGLMEMLSEETILPGEEIVTPTNVTFTNIDQAAWVAICIGINPIIKKVASRASFTFADSPELRDALHSFYTGAQANISDFCRRRDWIKSLIRATPDDKAGV